MIASLARFAESKPGLGAVKVRFTCGHWNPLRIVACKHESPGFPPDLRTILACDEPGEVGEMCERPTIDGDTFTAPTARLYLWDGREVEWEILEPIVVAGYAGGIEIPAKLTGAIKAVILTTSDPTPVERVREAARACEEAGVQFVIAEAETVETRPGTAPYLPDLDDNQRVAWGDGKTNHLLYTYGTTLDGHTYNTLHL